MTTASTTNTTSTTASVSQTRSPGSGAAAWRGHATTPEPAICPPAGPGLACELRGDQLTFVVPVRVSRRVFLSGALSLLLLRTHLRRPAALALLRDHLPVHEELSAPDAPRLTPRQCGIEAVLTHRALQAERLGRGDVVELLREEQLRHRPRAVVAARQVLPYRLLDGLGLFDWLDGEHRHFSPTRFAVGLLIASLVPGPSGRTCRNKQKGR